MLAQLRSVVDGLPEGTDRPNLEDLKLYKPGSSAENIYGYKGQLAIREQFMMSVEIRRLLQQTTVIASSEEIEAAAIKSGMRTMRQDGFLKAIAGETTVEEIYRVLG
jgi:general secretion pathway protein E